MLLVHAVYYLSVRCWLYRITAKPLPAFSCIVLDPFNQLSS